MSSENNIQGLKAESMQIYQKYPCNFCWTKQKKPLDICDMEQLKTTTEESIWAQDLSP